MVAEAKARAAKVRAVEEAWVEARVEGLRVVSRRRNRFQCIAAQIEVPSKVWSGPGWGFC